MVWSIGRTWSDDEWQLVPVAATVEEAGAEVIPFPKLAYYPDLKVACGAFEKVDRLAAASTEIDVQTDRSVDPKHHFVVRANGDSMDGGDHPIRDGDLVLCEWVTSTTAAQVQGKPHLLVGFEGPETSFAAMKVPIKSGNSWVLRSWNPEFADQQLPSGAKLEPVARVLSVVDEASGLTLFGKYDRDVIAEAFGSKNNPSWKVGHRDIDVAGKPHTVLMVTLRKGTDVKPEHRYVDRFLSREEFQWESQASTTAESLKGRRIRLHEDEGRSVHDDFTYCGRLHFRRSEGEKPLRVWWDLERRLPDGLWRRWR